MICQKCNFENPDNASYCINCGARIDGKILCPKCKKPISPDEDKCPHCGRKIPHASKEDNQAPRRGERIFNIFERLFAIFTIVMISFTLINVLTGMVCSSYAFSNAIEGRPWYLLVGAWIDGIPDLKSAANSYEYSVKLMEIMIPSILVLINIVICVLFGTLGIVKCAKYLSRNEKYRPFCFAKEFAIITIVNALTSNMCVAVLKGAYSVSFWKEVLIFFNYLLLAGMFIFFALTSRERKRFAILFEKAFFALVFFVGAKIIAVYTSKFIEVDHVFYKEVEYFFDSIKTMASVSDTNILVTMLGISILYGALIAILVSSLMVFVVVGYFSSNDRKMRYKIPTNVVALITLISATIYLGLNAAIVIYLNSNLSMNATLLYKSYEMFILSNFLFGFSAAALGISRAYRNYERLVAQTTAK